MPANTAAIFVLTPKRPQARVSTANTARDGTGTLATIATAGSNGAFYKGVRITPETAVNAGDVVRLFNQAAGAGNNEMIVEIYIPPMNPAASAANAPPAPVLQTFEWFPPAGIVLAATDVFKASTDQGETYCVALEGGGDY